MNSSLKFKASIASLIKPYIVKISSKVTNLFIVKTTDLKCGKWLS